MTLKDYRDYILTESDRNVASPDQRLSDRVAVEGPLPHPLCMDDRVTPVKNVRPIDVSPRGLGMLCEQYIPAGTFLWLQTENGPIALEVVYCEPYLGLDSLFRVGLFSRHAEVNLRVLVLGK